MSDALRDPSSRPTPSGSGPSVVTTDAAATPAPIGATALADPAERGRLEVADRVIERIAAHAATQVTHVSTLPARMSERLPGRRTADARASATTSGHLVQLRVTVGLDYPVPIVSATRAVRQHVRDTVTFLCGVEVRDVDVEVGRLQPPTRARRVS